MRWTFYGLVAFLLYEKLIYAVRMEPAEAIPLFVISARGSR